MHARPRRRETGFAILPILLVLIVAVVLWTQRNAILGWFGTTLVESATPQRCDAILILAGGGQGERILKGMELMHKGLAPIALVSDAMPIYEQSECRLAVEMAVRRGARTEWFQCVAPRVRSTREEAEEVVKVLRSRGAKSSIIVTTEFHTRRAARIFRAAAPEIRFYPVPAASVDFSIERWYQSREGRKTIFLEWTKALAGLLGA